MFYWNLFFYRDRIDLEYDMTHQVLILVLLELILLPSPSITLFNILIYGFNPCFIGTYSFTDAIQVILSEWNIRFNPCFIGTYSFTC